MKPADVVHVWSVDLTVPPDEGLVGCLSSDEQERARRFRFDEHRGQFVAARCALRGVLARWLGIDADQVRFQYGPAGKPELAPKGTARDTHFNVSHSGDVALIAVSRGRRVGVDIERHRAMPDLPELVRRHFHVTEQRAFSTLDEPVKEQAFFACWTRKEAYLKAIGSGLTGGLSRFAVSFLPEEEPRLIQSDEDPGARKHWRLLDVSPGTGFTAALAVEGHDWNLVSEVW